MKMGIERVLKEQWADLAEVIAVTPAEGEEGGAAPLSLDVVDEALGPIMPAITGLGASVEVLSASGGVVRLQYTGPPKIKYGIELALLDTPQIEKVEFETAAE